MTEMQAEAYSHSTAMPTAGGSANIGAGANNALLAPVIIASNVGLAAMNAVAEGASQAANMAARALGASRLPLVDAFANIIGSTADRVSGEARKGLELAASKVRETAGGTASTSPNRRL